jgi:hypothetical protein
LFDTQNEDTITSRVPMIGAKKVLFPAKKRKDNPGSHMFTVNDSVKIHGTRELTEKYTAPFTSEIGSISYISKAWSHIGVAQVISSLNSLQTEILIHECSTLEIDFQDTGLKYSSLSKRA